MTFSIYHSLYITICMLTIHQTCSWRVHRASMCITYVSLQASETGKRADIPVECGKCEDVPVEVPEAGQLVPSG